MKQYTSWIVMIAVAAVLIAGMIWYAGRPGQYDAFAMCVAESGATFYGAFWCPHCQEQKALFGRSAKKLPYLECSTVDGRSQLPICADENIETYPTWEWKDGTRNTGTLSLSQISSITGCPLTKD